MSTKRPTHRASIVRYEWRSPDGVDDHADREYAIDDDLKRQWAVGFVEGYDTGRGLVVWFTCPAGPRARDLRDWVEARLPSGWIKGSRS